MAYNKDKDDASFNDDKDNPRAIVVDIIILAIVFGIGYMLVKFGFK
jgi:hypothetical protein